MKANVVLRAILGIVLMGTAFSSQKHLSCEDTRQRILPPHFGYFENLYVNPSQRAFYTLGKSADLSVPFFTDNARGFSCKKYHYLPFSKNVFHHTPGLTLILCERSTVSMHYSHFYHMLEHLIGLWSFGGEDNRDKAHLFLIACNDVEEKNWKGLNALNLHLIKALFPNAQVKLLTEFLQESSRDICFTQALISNRCIQYLKPPSDFIEGMLGAYYTHLLPTSIDRLSSAICEYFGAAHHPSEKRIVTYVRRFYPMHLRADIEKELLDKIAQLPNTEVRIVDFAFSAFKNQIQAAANTDVLLGVHGNGLCHTLFLPKGATLIELFPKESLRNEYRVFAQLRQLKYGAMMSGRGWIDAQTAESIGAHGDTQMLVEDIDVDAIVSVIEKLPKSLD